MLKQLKSVPNRTHSITRKTKELDKQKKKKKKLGADASTLLYVEK